MWNDIMTELRKPFAISMIKQRKEERTNKKTGKTTQLTFDYVEAAAVIDRLNDATGGVWQFTILHSEDKENNISVLGKLSLYHDTLGWLSKEQYGSAQYTGAGESWGDMHKAATSDALKKCAQQWGVANHLFGGELQPEVYGNNEEESVSHEMSHETAPAVPFMDTKVGRDYHASFETAAKAINPIAFLEILDAFGYQDTNDIQSEEAAKRVLNAMREYVRAEKAKAQT